MTEAERLAQDAKKIVEPPTAQRRQRQSPDQYTGYMALVRKCVVIEPSSFEEAVEDPARVDVVEEYDSIVRNSAWEIVPRLEGKSVVGSRWIYKVMQMGWHIHQMDVNTVFLPGGWRKEDTTSVEVVDATVYRQLVESRMCRLKRGTSRYGSWYREEDADWVGSPTDDIRYHHIKDCVQRRIMLLSYIPMEDQDADILTKALTRSKFEYHQGRIGVADNPYLVEREC